MAPHALLAELADLPVHGLSWEFLDGFVPRAIEIQISTGGVLGVMQFMWRPIGHTDWSPAVSSSSASPWVVLLGEAFANLTWPAGAYTIGVTYTVDESGAVTVPGGAPALSASRYDLRARALRRATDDALGWMSPKDNTSGGVTPPLLSWGEDIRSRVARLAAIYLKKTKGVAPENASVADATLLKDEDRIIDWFKGVGSGDETPVDLVDSSTASSSTADGTLFDTVSDDPRRW